MPCQGSTNLNVLIFDITFTSIFVGDHILLAPTVNTQRSPLGGRGFESFSEDPHLNGIIAAAYINGLQSHKVAATIKHYVANDQEYQR
jgi:beta-glucosidase